MILGVMEAWQELVEGRRVVTAGDMLLKTWLKGSSDYGGLESLE